MEEKIWKPVYNIDGSVRMVQIPAEEKPVNVVEKSCSCGGTCSCANTEDVEDEEEDWDYEENLLEGKCWADVFEHGNVETFSTYGDEVKYYTADDMDKTVILHGRAVIVVDSDTGVYDLYDSEDEISDEDLLPYDWKDEIE